jgi:hypothetical protein
MVPINCCRNCMLDLQQGCVNCCSNVRRGKSCADVNESRNRCRINCHEFRSKIDGWRPKEISNKYCNCRHMGIPSYEVGEWDGEWDIRAS